MADATPHLWHPRDPDRHQGCAWILCPQDASDRWPLPLCQEHALYIWSVVDADIRESGKTAEDLKREQRERSEARIRDNAEQARAAGRRARTAGFIYYLEVGGLIKIGFTRNAWRRGSEYPPSAELLAMHYGTEADERRIHERFAAYRDAGREWYLDCQEIRDHIATLAAAPGEWKRAMSRRKPPVRALRKPTRTVL